MYQLLEYSDNFSVTSRCLWKFHRDEVNNNANENDNNLRTNNVQTPTSKSF